jgi:2-polyprenyl-6-methoxyphenol hydroxylase-like FAD-dependent oxidoreductase
MNTGIQDAVALGHALADVLGGRADESQLDSYERTRRPVAARVVAFTDRMTRMATLRTPRSRAARNAMIEVIGRMPPIRHWLATELAGLHNPPVTGGYTT